jgi:hypothetical protein
VHWLRNYGVCIHDRTDLLLPHRIPYEIFYAVHLLFVLYIVTVAHTVDHMQRSNTRPRVKLSTGYQQLSCTISAIGRLHTSIITTRQSSNRLLLPREGSKMVVLKMAPYSLQFKPGQYACTSQFHRFVLASFSIASGPDSPFIEFYIEVFNEQSWTGKLWQLINDNRAEEGRTGVPFASTLTSWAIRHGPGQEGRF